MRLITIAIFAFVLNLEVAGQLAHLQSFGTNLIPTDSLFPRNAFIDSVLQNKKIVLLGELDHGDGTSFEVKTKLIRYLHEELGYNTLVFEAGFINSNLLWENLLNGQNFTANIQHNIYNIWSEVKETERLFEYIKAQNEKGTPLKLVGMDPQFSGRNNTDGFIQLLQTKLPPTVIQAAQYGQFLHELKLMSQWMQYPKSKDHLIDEATFHAYCDHLKETIIREVPGEKTLWEVYFENIKVMAAIKWLRTEGAVRRGLFEKRDKQMFENLNYWLTQDPNEKCIVWAANAHIIRNDRLLAGKDKNYYLVGLKKLGDHLYEKYSDAMYSIGIAAGTGSTVDFLNTKKFNKIAEHNKGALEAYMDASPGALVDLKLFEKAFQLDRYESQMLYTNIKCTSKWSNHFDGFIYIHQMKPSTPIW